jgi:regulator of nucleoside diphosphate kinase
MSQSALPPITLNRQDFNRLEALLAAPQWHDHPTAQALARELDRAQLLAPTEIAADLVTMNSTVTCVEEMHGLEHTVTLSYPAETGKGEGRVSVLAPVGAALLGLSVGQRIDWSGPDGRPLRLRVSSIGYQPEAAGHFHL